MTTELDAAAKALVEFLTKPSQYGDRLSPIESFVRERIAALAREIATHAVHTTDGLAEQIEQKVKYAINKAMRDDAYFTEAIVKAVGTAIGKYREED